MAVAWLLGLILLACWAVSFVTISDPTATVPGVDEPAPVVVPSRRVLFARGETAANPLVAASHEAILDEAIGLSGCCPRSECGGCHAARVSRVRYGNEVRYAIVSECESCRFRFTRYYRLLSGQGGVGGEEATGDGALTHAPA